MYFGLFLVKVINSYFKIKVMYIDDIFRFSIPVRDLYLNLYYFVI
jgi:hypothetical protein